MKQVYFLLLFLVSFLGFAQAPEFLWASSVGGTDLTTNQGIVVDESGNVYSCGYYTGNTDFDPGIPIHGLMSNGGEDVFVQKLDSKGNLVWAWNFGDSLNDRALSIALDKENNLLVCGSFRGVVDFDPGLEVRKYTATGIEDGFILKLDAEGKFIWAVQFAGTGSVVCTHVSVDEEGNGLLTGYFSASGFTVSGANSLVISSEQIPGYTTSSLIGKFTSSGEFLWIKKIENSSGICIKSDKESNLYIGGTYLGTVDFNPGDGDTLLTSYGNGNSYFLKLGPEGNFEWVNQISGPGLGDIAITENSEMLATGWVFVFELVGQNPSHWPEVFIVKLNHKGEIEWEKQVGGKKADYGYGLAVNSKGEIFIAGCFQDSTDFDPGEGVSLSVAKSPSDIFILKLDSSANYIWKGTIIGTVYDGSSLGISVSNYSSGISVVVDNKDNVHVAGRYHRYTDFGVGDKEFHMSPLGYGDAYYLKIGKVDEKLPVDTLGLGVFPNPCSKELYITDGAIGSTIEVFDVNGKLIHKSGIGDKRKVVNVETWSEGLYFLRRVKNDKRITTLKIIKL